MRLIYILTFSTLVLLTKAQNPNYTIKGKALSLNKEIIEFGNIIALNPNDSSLIKGSAFEAGLFKLEPLINDSLLIKITSVGYSDYYQHVVRPKNDTLVDLGEIIMPNGKSLNEVTITAKIPLFEMDGEKVKVNVENTSLTNAGNALDVLRRSPGVNVNAKDIVTIFGKGTAIIYVDGMLISTIDILRSLPSTDIKTIEIINNPSAKYDAGGRAVINIITVRNSLQGYNGNIIQNTLYIKSIFSYTGLRFNLTKKKWTTNISLGTTKGEQWSSDVYKRNYKTNDTVNVEMINSIYDTPKHTDVYYYRAGFNYRPDSVTTIGMQYNGFYDSKNTLSKNNNSIFTNNTTHYKLNTTTFGRPITNNNAINANYIRNFDTLGSELFIAAQVGAFKIKNTSNINQQATVSNINSASEKRNLNRNSINIIGAQVDFTKAFNKHWKLAVGLKESYISKTSDIKFETLNANSVWISDSTYKNGFNFSENILAGYAELKFKKKKFNSRIGIRSEFTKSDGFSKTLNQSIINRSYVNYFPSAFFGYDFTKDLTTSLTLSSRINRPTFQDLDPFINYIDSVTSFRGNPYLLPEYTNSIEASLIYMKEANLTIGYNYTKGAMRLVVDKLTDSTDAFTAVTKNLNNSETYSFGITIPYELEWWTTANYFGYFLNNYTYQQNGILIKNYKPTYTIYLYDEFRFKKLFSLELTYEYTSSAVDGIFSSNPFSQLSATIKKTFFKDKLTCRFTANDILNTYIMSGNSNIPLYNINYESKFSTHYFLLALNYRFGKLKNSNYKNRSVSDEEYSRVKTGK